MSDILEPKQISGVWLTASDRFITDRILCESNFYGVDKDAQYLITKFIARTLLYNRRLQENIRHLELEHIELKPNMTVEELIRECCDFLRSDLN